MSPLDIDHPDDRENDSRLFAEYLKGLRPTHEIEKRYIRKDGQTIWVQVSAVAGPRCRGTSDAFDWRSKRHYRTQADRRCRCSKEKNNFACLSNMPLPQ